MCLSFTRDVIGSITRTVIDSATILEVIAGKDPGDSESSSNPVPRYVEFLKLNGGLKGKRFGVPKKYFFEVIHPDTLTVIDEAIREIRKMGGIIEEVEVKYMDFGAAARVNIVMPECIYLLEDYLQTFDPQATIEKYLDQLGPDAKSRLGTQKGLPESNPIPGYAYVKSVRDDRNKMIYGFERALSGLDGLLIPTTPLPASKIGDDVETELEGKMVNTFLTLTRNCYPINIVGYPAITVPAGYSKLGLPIGLQIVVRPWEEENLLSMAYAFEQATKVRKAPKL